MAVSSIGSSSGRSKLNLWECTALVAGTMIGSGVFLLPASLAAFGGISILGWIFSTVGAVLLALTLSRLSRRIPKAGGPYAFTQAAFGRFAGFLIGWGYWVALLTGAAAVAVAAVGYLGVFFPVLSTIPIWSALTACFGIWLLTGINSSGVKLAGVVQVLMTLLKILPLILIAYLGFIGGDMEYFRPFNASDHSDFDAVTATATLTLWAFLGIESATVAAENVDNPTQNVGRATILGTATAAIVYISSTMAVMALVPGPSLSQSTAPFADAAASVIGPFGGQMVAIGAVISCLGALNGMIMILGQMPYALSRDRLFHPLFSKLSRRGTPHAAQLLSAALTTIFILLNYSKGLVDLFTFIILLSTLSVLLPYAFSTMAEWMLIVKAGGHKLSNNDKRAIFLSGLAFAYTLWVINGAGQEVVYWGFLLFLTGIPFYVYFSWSHRDSEH